MTEFVLTTHPGLETVAVEEITRRLGRPPDRADTEPGRARIELPDDAQDTLLKLRSVHHVLRGITRIAFPHPVTIDAIQAAVAGVEIPGLSQAPSFRVRSVRRGQHPFRHMDIERAAGAVLHTATGVKVDLTQPALTVRVDLEADVVWIGTLLTDRPLSRRAKVYAQQIGLSADLAYAASHVLELSAPQRILDPFCGSGTLLLEAGAVHSDCELWASDWAPSAVDGARRNLDAAGFTARSFVRELDALKMSETYPTASFDAIVCNPPFGVKMGKSINFYRFYHRLLAEADRVLKPNGKLAVWAHRRGQLSAAAASHAVFEPFKMVTVQTGKARPVLVALRRRG